MPDTPDVLLTRAWFDAACTFIHNIAANVTADMARQGRSCLNPPGRPCMSPADFTGMMIIGGNCTSELYDAIATSNGTLTINGTTIHVNITDPELEEVVEYLLSSTTVNNPEHAATKVHVTTTIDPFGSDGRAWIQASALECPW